MLSAEKREELKTKLNSASLPEKTKVFFRIRWGLDDGTFRSSREAAKLLGTNHRTIIDHEDKVFAVIDEDKDKLQRLASEVKK